MLEALMNSNKLNVNCSVACLIKDSEGFLDKFDGVNLNCGTYLASSSVNAKMLSLGANINTDRTIITGDDEEFVQISGGTLENGEDFAGVFVIAEGNIILRGNGVHAFEKAAGAVVSGTVYHPASCPQDLLARVQGEKRPYPDDAFVLLGGRELKRLLAGGGSVGLRRKRTGGGRRTGPSNHLRQPFYHRKPLRALQNPF